MRRFITSVAITAIVIAGSAISAQAKVPDAVMKPYKAYSAALKSGDEKAAFQNAKKAWDAAEKLLGDHKTTGDLAHNFADLSESGTNPLKNFKLRMKARERAVELAKLYPEDKVGETVTARTLKLVETSLILNVRRKGKIQAGGEGRYFDDAERAIETYGYTGHTFEAELEAYKSQFYSGRGSHKKAIDHADRAMEIYKSRGDDIFSAYKYIVPIYKGNSLKDLDRPIDAALQYQIVMQNLEGEVPSDHVLVQSAFAKWMITRSELEDAGRLGEAEQAGLCECWPFEDYKSKVTPLKRMPPKMPSSFMRGRFSGHVMVIFDVDDEGKAMNIRKLSSTHEVLEKPALKSVEDWIFSPKIGDEPEGARKGISNKITFRLTSSNGRLLPEPEA